MIKIPSLKSLTINDNTYEIVDEKARNGLTEIPSKVNDALSEAKENGEFDGKSAYEYAKEAGYPGTEDEFAALLADMGSSEGEAVEIFSAYLSEDSGVGAWDALSEQYWFNLPQELIEGKTYVVTLDGTKYTATAVWSEDDESVVVAVDGVLTLWYYKEEEESNAALSYEWEDKEYAYSEMAEADVLIWKPVNFSIGEPGKSEPNATGVYVLAEGETIDDAPEDAQVVVDPDGEPPAVEMVATFADGTSSTFVIYGEAVE